MTLVDSDPVPGTFSDDSFPILYSKPGCQQCIATGRYLDKRGVAYLYVDVTEEEHAVETVRELGYTQVPVVEVNGDHWYGYNPGKLAEHFGV